MADAAMAFQVGMASLEGGLQLLQRLEEEEQPLKRDARAFSVALPPLFDEPAAQQAVHGADDAGFGRAAQLKRMRDVVHSAYHPADAELPHWAGLLESSARGEAQDAVQNLFGLTSYVTRAKTWRSNQADFAGLNGVCRLTAYISKRAAGGTAEDFGDVLAALMVLENLSSNEDLLPLLAHSAGCVPLLVTLMGHAVQGVKAKASMVLINITCSSAPLQQLVAVAPGSVEAALALLADPNPACPGLGAWLLSNLTAWAGSPVRSQVAGRPAVLGRLAELLLCGVRLESRAAGEPKSKAEYRMQDDIHVRCCEVLCNVARSGSTACTAVLQADVAPRLTELADPRGNTPGVVAAALAALAALALSGLEAARAVAGVAGLLGHLQGVLAKSLYITRDYDLASALCNAHTLVYALGFMAKRHGATLLPPPAAAAAPGAQGDCGLDALQLQAQRIVEETSYVTLPAAARMLSLELPRYSPDLLAQEDDSSAVGGSSSSAGGGPQPQEPAAAAAATTAVVAGIAHHINVECLPLLRHGNARMVANACARLYQIAVCLAPHPAHRKLLTNSDLLRAVLALLGAGHSGVVQAALALVGALAAVPECLAPLMQCGAVDAAEALGMEHARAGPLGDPLILLLADRALVGMSITADAAEAAL